MAFYLAARSISTTQIPALVLHKLPAWVHSLEPLHVDLNLSLENTPQHTNCCSYCLVLSTDRNRTQVVRLLSVQLIGAYAHMRMCTQCTLQLLVLLKGNFQSLCLHYTLRSSENEFFYKMRSLFFGREGKQHPTTTSSTPYYSTGTILHRDYAAIDHSGGSQTLSSLQLTEGHGKLFFVFQSRNSSTIRISIVFDKNSSKSKQTRQRLSVYNGALQGKVFSSRT